MPLLILRAPDIEPPISTPVEAGEEVLVGREPNLDQATGGERLQVARVPSPQVSRNHARVTVDGEGVATVEDLGSKHGTWLRVPANTSAQIDAPQIELLLADRRGRGEVERAPVDAEWASAAGFAEAVRRAVQPWLDARGIRARATIGRSDPQDQRDPWAFALGDGSMLHVSTTVAWTQPAPATDVQAVLRAYIGRQNAILAQEEGHGAGIILASPAIRRAHREVVEAAARGARVVLLGPRGSGKEELARCYHLHSRAEGPWIHLICGLLVGEIGYVDLFGAVAGGAQGIHPKPGAVEEANHGTLFLDELADLDARYQSALLGFLNEGHDRQGKRVRGAFFRLGDKSRASPRYAADASVVSATNVDLDDENMRRHRGFRDDLWDRLATCVVRVPPLADRPEDVRAYLAAHPVDSPVKLIDALTPEALEITERHRWPGNFREMAAFRVRLPPALAPRSIDAAACREALRRREELRPAAREPTAREPTAREPAPASPSADEWARINEAATRAFEREKGGVPRTADLPEYMNHYLKPILLAHAAGLQSLREVPRGLNLSDLARRLNLADGTTVRRHLERYVEISRE